MLVTVLLFFQEMSGVAAVLDALRDSAEKNLTELQELQMDIQADKAEAEDLLAKGKEGRQVSSTLLLHYISYFNLLLPDSTCSNLFQPAPTYSYLLLPDSTCSNLLITSPTWSNLLLPST